MSSSQLDLFAAAALQGLLIDREWDNAEELARESFRIARAMMAERLRQNELPDSEVMESDILAEPLEVLDLALRITKKLRGIGIERVRDLTLTTETQVRRTGLGDESLAEIRNALHRHGLTLAA
jgi:DNA-directed RNA polymerase alpha subunit